MVSLFACWVMLARFQGQQPKECDAPDAISVGFLHNNIFGGPYGKKDGIRKGDRMIVVRRTPQGLLITGFGTVYEVISDTFDAAGRDQGWCGGDVAYIVSRDNSRYSLMKQKDALFSPPKERVWSRQNCPSSPVISIAKVLW